MRSILIRIALVCVLLFSGTDSFASTSEFIFKNHGQVVKKLSLQEITTLVPPEEKSIVDALAQTTIVYKVVSLTALLEKVYGQQSKQAEGILLTCADGFQPFLPNETFSRVPAYLAFERVGQTAFSLVNKAEANKTIPLGPYYLVWETGNQSATEDWAYQIVGLDLINFADRFPQTAPSADSAPSVKRGFVAFSKNCIACHTINGEGGGKAPELNYPVNITEYYNEGWLKKWIENPNAIRLNASMPPLGVAENDKKAVINDLIAYLKDMAKNKRAPK